VITGVPCEGDVGIKEVHELHNSSSLPYYYSLPAFYGIVLKWIKQ
jgi:hypothetical protein